MSKQKTFTEALDNLVSAFYKVNDAWPIESYGSEDYPFTESFDTVIRDVEIWRDAEQEILETPWWEETNKIYKNIKPSMFSWNYDNTGGGCMVSFKDYTCKDGIKRMIGLNDENASLYKVDYSTYNTEEYYDSDDADNESLASIYGLYEYKPDETTFVELKPWLTDDQIEDVITGYLIYQAQ